MNVTIIPVTTVAELPGELLHLVLPRAGESVTDAARRMGAAVVYQLPGKTGQAFVKANGVRG